MVQNYFKRIQTTFIKLNKNMNKTALFDKHVALGAKIVPFAGFEMPVQYSGVNEEHFAVRERVGIFDVSHMGQFLIEGAGKKFLVDCGLHQGRMEEEILNDRPFEYDVSDFDFMLLTHAHIDHSGRIPKLYNEGYRNPIYATKATCDLCSIMLPDSGHIQEMENEWKNKKGC